MGRSVGEKAAQATRKGMAAKEIEVLTPEKALKEIRGLRAAKLFVCNMHMVDLLLAEYDALVEVARQQEEDIDVLKGVQADNEKYIARNNELAETVLKIRFNFDERGRHIIALQEKLAALAVVSAETVASLLPNPPAGAPDSLESHSVESVPEPAPELNHSEILNDLGVKPEPVQELPPATPTAKSRWDTQSLEAQ